MKNLSFFVTMATALASSSLVQAHQNFHQIWINGVTPGYQKCIRMPPSNNPVVKNMLPDLELDFSHGNG